MGDMLMPIAPLRQAIGSARRTMSCEHLPVFEYFLLVVSFTRAASIGLHSFVDQRAIRKECAGYLAVVVVSFGIYVVASQHEFDFIETNGYTSIDRIKEALCEWPGVAIGINLAIQLTQYPINPKETGIKNQNLGILWSYRLTVGGKKSCAASPLRPAGDVHMHDELGR
jgi:hypothetical protein